MLAPFVDVVGVDTGHLAQGLEGRLAVPAPGCRAGTAPREEPSLPLAGLEPGRAAEAQDRRARLERDGLTAHRRIGQVDVGPGLRVEGLAVEREACRAAEHEVELLVAALDLVVRLDDVL